MEYKPGQTVTFRLPDNQLGRAVCKVLNQAQLELPDPDDPENPDKHITVSRMALEGLIAFGMKQWENWPSRLLVASEQNARLEKLETLMARLLRRIESGLSSPQPREELAGLGSEIMQSLSQDAPTAYRPGD